MNKLIPKSFKQEILLQNRIVKYNNRINKLIRYIHRKTHIKISEQPCFVKGCGNSYQALYVRKLIKISNYFIGEVYCKKINDANELKENIFINNNTMMPTCSGKVFVLFKSIPPQLSCSPNNEDLIQHMVFKK